MARRNSLDNDFLGQARDALKREDVERVLYCLLRASARPERIGTSMRDLRKMANAGDLRMAEENLGRARGKKPWWPNYRHQGPEVYRIRMYLARARAKPEAIGTTEAELEKLALHGPDRPKS